MRFDIGKILLVLASPKCWCLIVVRNLHRIVFKAFTKVGVSNMLPHLLAINEKTAEPKLRLKVLNPC